MAMSTCVKALAVMNFSLGHDKRPRDPAAVHQQVAPAAFSPNRRAWADSLLCRWRLHHRVINALSSPNDALPLVVLGRTAFHRASKKLAAGHSTNRL